jgi:hypothetical protein
MGALDRHASEQMISLTDVLGLEPGRMNECPPLGVWRQEGWLGLIQGGRDLYWLLKAQLLHYQVDWNTLLWQF